MAAEMRCLEGEGRSQVSRSVGAPSGTNAPQARRPGLGEARVEERGGGVARWREAHTA